jgi:hypothetical protein
MTDAEIFALVIVGAAAFAAGLLAAVAFTFKSLKDIT